MKETPLLKAFEDASHKFGADRFQQEVARQLSVLQAVVQNFHEADVQATLDLRPGNDGCPLSADDHSDLNHEGMLANGLITLDGLKLDVVIQKCSYHDDCVESKIFRDGAEVLSQVSTYDEEKKRWEDEEPEEDEDAEDDAEREDIDEEKAPAKAKTFKGRLTALLLDLKVRNDFVGRFNVGPEGVWANTVEKPLTGPPQLKPRKQDKP